MRRIGVLAMVVLAATMAIGVGSASALSGGGKKPSEAPLLNWGQHYEASLGNNKAEANYVSTCCGNGSQVAIWHLGPLSVHDQVVVNWHELPFSHGTSFPVRMLFVENIEDFNWGSTFGRGESSYQVSGSGTARAEITVQNSSSNDYLEFFSGANETNSQDFETYLYDFTVEAPRHYLSVSLGSVQKVAANGVLHATATLATGAPAPDGMIFTLTGTWSSGGTFTTTGASVAGQVTFPLALPETAYKHSVEFVATSAATPEWQAATSPKLTVEVTKPPTPVPAVEPQLCTKATTRAHVLARQYHRQLRHASEARGKRRRRLMREARATGRRLDAAKAARKAAC
ncbi:MAG TPA: hypothetical protein VJL81_10775 [Solirubrobacterales bacterium]|nr:hypothetical protein [Solirubrobacterales bacterium]